MRFNRLRSYPKRPNYEAGTRRYQFSVYPYSLIYRVTEQEITIVAVAHAKRKPGYWTNRE